MMSTTRTLYVIVTAAILVISGEIIAQDEEQLPLYVSVDCMKSTTADYATVEAEIWQPMHQELVNQGKRDSWSLYWVKYGDRSKCDYYTVTTYLGRVQLNVDPGFDTVFQAVHPDADLEQAMARTWASRQHIATELWLRVDSTDINEHRFAVVNKMYAEDPDAYERMETQVFKAGHQALIESGHRAGWGMYDLISPLGTSIPYNFSTVDFVNHVNPVPMAEAMMTAHPDRDLEDMHDLLELRDHVSSETWELVSSTE